MAEDNALTASDDMSEDFMAYCLKRREPLPQGVYTLRLIPMSLRLLNSRNVAYDLHDADPNMVHGVEARFRILDAKGRAQIGREFRHGFACVGPSTLDQIIAEDLKALAAWLDSINGPRVPAGRLDLLAKALEQGTKGRPLVARISHRSGPRLRIDRIALSEIRK
jgi:hypothetical protein